MRKILFATVILFSTLKLAVAQREISTMSPVEVAAYIQAKDEMNEQIIRTFIYTVNQQNIQIAELKKQVAKLEQEKKHQKKIKRGLVTFLTTTTAGTIILILLKVL